MSPWISSGKSSQVTHHQEAILLAAWRGKLSEEEWESRIRKVLPRGVNGDVYDLADCLLKQALVGPIPNQLFISYLKHAVRCKLVSHGAVLSSIAHQSTNIRPNNSAIPHRTSSVICLLEFLKSFRDNISCKGTEIECLNLCHSLSQLIHWLLKCVLNSLEYIVGGSQYPNQQQPQQQQLPPSINTNMSINAHQMGNQIGNTGSTVNNLAQFESIVGVIDLCNETIHYFINRTFTKSLIFISKLEYSKEFDDILKTIQVIQHKLDNCIALKLVKEKHSEILKQLDYIFNSRDMHPCVVAAHQLRCLQTHRIRSTNVTSGSNFEKNTSQNLLATNDSTLNYALFNSLYCLVAFDVVLRPARSHKALARQIAVITNFNSAPMHMTYCELIRVCMIGLIDTDGTPAKIKWAFFTFLKLPKLLLNLSRSTANHSQESKTNSTDCFASNQVTNFINDLKLAFERLCEYSPLLDEAEYKCNCDFFKCLVKELIKNDPGLLQLKNVDFRNFPTRRAIVNNNDRSVGGEKMLKTEPVVTSVLEALDTAQDPMELYGILSHLVSGKQFEYTLSCAASTGRLQLLVKKLVEHNEVNRTAQGDMSKNFQIQALIFDITFLMLTYIAQQCGPEVIGSEQQTTFSKWFYECYNTCTRVNCPQEMLKNSNEETVTSLIKQFCQPGAGGVQMTGSNWRDVCSNIPKSISEILNAWNQGFLTDEDMQIIIERIKSKMCFVAVVTATWLQCHIKTLNDADRVKPLTLLQSLTKPSQYSRQQKLPTNIDIEKQERYLERSSLMLSIIRKINFELCPKSNSNTSANNSNLIASQRDTDETIDESSYQSINDRFISTLTTQEIFLANVKQCLSRGWADYKTLNSLNSLFKMIGSECFTNLIVEQILTSHESPSDLSRAVHITFGLFHLDIEACAFALLKDTIPSWLMGEKKQVLLNQPRAFALAHLTVMTIIEVFSNLKAAQSSTQTSILQSDDKKSSSANGIIAPESGLMRPAILLDSDKSLAPRDIKRIKLATNDICDNEETNQDNSEKLEKLNGCIADLMRLFKAIMSDSVMSQRTLFPVLFLQQTIICTREESSIITAHLQPEILLDMINLFSSELTFELVLAISNLLTTNSRKYAAKAMCQLAEVKESKVTQQ